MNIEIRNFSEPVEVRSEDGKITAVGTAIRYGALSKNMGGWVERIMPGAAKKTLAERDVIALHEHDRAMLLGRSSAGTLRLFNDDSELRYEIDLPDTTAGRDVAESLQRGDLRGASFGFKAIKSAEKWTTTDDGLALRSVGELMLDHISTTVAPAYDSSTSELALRSLAESTGRDVRVLVDAARNGDLAHLIDPDHRDETPGDDEDDSRETTVVRERISYLY